MRPFIFVGIVLLIFALPAGAQTGVPVLEVAGGYSLLPSNFTTDFPRRTSHGVGGSVAINVTRSFGVVGDVAMQWNTTSDLGPNFAGQTAHTNVREFLVGPRFTKRLDGLNVFAGGWVGTSIGHADASFKGFADSGLTFGGGGGVDIRVSPRAAIRAQYDLIGSFADIVEGNSRLGVGLVVGVGKR